MTDPGESGPKKEAFTLYFSSSEAVKIMLSWLQAAGKDQEVAVPTLKLGQG